MTFRCKSGKSVLGWMILLSVFIFQFAGNASLQPKWTGIVKLDIFSSQDKAYPGTKLKLALQVEIKEGWHINSSAPFSDFLIPCGVSIPEDYSVSIKKVIFPEALETHPDFSQEIMSVYQGTIWIGILVEIPEQTAKKELEIPLHFRYQGCNDRACFPPSMETAVLTVPIAEEGSSIHEIHPEIFSRIDFSRQP